MPERSQVTLWPRMQRGHWIALAIILAVAVLLRGARLAEAPGGFLVFNEGFYIDLASRMARQPSLDWLLRPLDVNNPPLYGAIVAVLYRLGLPAVAGARVVSVVAGTWSVFATFLLGRMLYGDRTGITAAALLAVMPGVVLVDHNIQVDALLVALVLTGLWLYVYAARAGSNPAAVTAGAVLGLALLTKHAALVAPVGLVTWEIWCARGFGWVRSARAWRFAAAFAVVGIPWYLVQFVTAGPRGVLGIASRAAGGVGGGFVRFWSQMVALELWSMLFPAALVLALVGLGLLAVRRSKADKLVLVMSLGYLLWYVVFHFHTYYLLPLAPFLALAAARAVDAAAEAWRPRAVFAVFGAILLAMALGSVLMLSGHKWGRWSPVYLSQAVGRAEKTELVVESQANGMLGPAMTLAGPLFDVRSQDGAAYAAEPSPPGDTSLLLATEATGGFVPLQALEETRLRPVLFGYAIARTPIGLTETQRFRDARLSAERVGPPWYFGVHTDRVPSGLYLYNRASFAP